MAYTYGTENANGVPINVAFTFDGTEVSWGRDNLESMAPLTNRSESIDGDYEISDLNITLIDTDGAIWNALGNGTTWMNKDFSATVYVGGQMGFNTYGPNGAKKLVLQDLFSSGTYPVHNGRVREVAKHNRMVRIKSRNNLAAIKDLEWRFPFTNYLLIAANYGVTPVTYGSNVFYDNFNIGTRFPNSLNDIENDGDKYTVYVAANPSVTNDYMTVKYPFIDFRSQPGLEDGYIYPGTQFYFDCPRVKMDGSWLGTRVGTINSQSDADAFGFPSVAAAEAVKIAGAGGGTYILNRTRLTPAAGTVPVSNRFYLQQNLTLNGNPADLFKKLLSAHCVTPLFGTSDIDPSTLATSRRVTQFLNFEQRIDPKGGKVSPYIKDLIRSIYGAFNVNTANKFEFRAYGPKNLNVPIGTLDATTVLDCDYSNDFETFKNRILVKYGYSFGSGTFTKEYEAKGISWSGSTDNTLTLESNWLRDEKEVKNLTHRLIRRFENGVPRISVTVPLKHVGAEIGSLFRVTDPDSGLDGKVIEVTQYSKDISDDRKVVLSGVDGDILYNRKGYGYWMGGLVLPSGPVSGTSTGGCGTAGTVANINMSIYGSQFVWW